MFGEIDHISKGEVRKALKMKNGKEVVPVQILAEVWKSLDEERDKIAYRVPEHGNEERDYPERMAGIMMPLFKEKGDFQSCNKERGIKLTAHTMKLRKEETEARSEQLGFKKGRETMDAVFELRQVMEKYGEKKKKRAVSVY